MRGSRTSFGGRGRKFVGAGGRGSHVHVVSAADRNRSVVSAGVWLLDREAVGECGSWTRAIGERGVGVLFW